MNTVRPPRTAPRRAVPPPLSPLPALGVVVALIVAFVGLGSVAVDVYADHGKWIDELGLFVICVGTLVLWVVAGRRHPDTPDDLDPAARRPAR